MIFDPAFWSMLGVLFLAPIASVLSKCCCSCNVCADDFNRSDDTDIDTGSACGWTESSGSWAISSNALVCSSAGLAICTATAPSSAMLVEADITHSNSGSWCDIVVALVDSTHYYYARYRFGSNTIQIWENDGGSHTAISNLFSATLTPSSTYTAKVCVGDNRITAYLDGTPAVTSNWINDAPTGTQSGLAASGTGTATFDDFSLQKTDATKSSCEACAPIIDCNGCAVDDTPETLLVTISGAATNSCGDCGDLNTTFVVEFDNNYAATACLYNYYLPSPICTINRVQVRVSANPGSNWEVVMVLRTALGTQILGMSKQDFSGEDLECETLNVDLSFFGWSSQCQGTVSCNVSAP